MGEAAISLRTRSKRIKEAAESQESLIEKPAPHPTLLSKALASTADLAKLLPTGILLAFQLLIPVCTTNGSCDAVTRPMTLVILLLLAASSFLACFTDSFLSQDGEVYYGFATPRGMWLFDYPAAEAALLPDLTRYRLRCMDFVHGVLSVLVFGAVALRDKNVVSCLYPQPKHEILELLDIVPLGVGIVCSLLFVAFPSRRHGIGYPVTNGK